MADIEGLGFFLLWSTIALVLYFLPSIVAGRLDHRNGLAVFVLNLLLGWTFLFWAIALIWACMGSQRRSVR